MFYKIKEDEPVPYPGIGFKFKRNRGSHPGFHIEILFNISKKKLVAWHFYTESEKKDNGFS